MKKIFSSFCPDLCLIVDIHLLLWSLFYTLTLNSYYELIRHPFIIVRNVIIFTARKRSLGQGNIFTPVCHSVHREGCVTGGCACPGRGGMCAWGEGGMHALGVLAGGMHGWGHAWLGAVRGRGHACHTPPPQAWYREIWPVNEWAVCILLECILVS